MVKIDKTRSGKGNTMGRMRLLEAANGAQFEGFCMVKSVAVRQNIKGSDYLDLVLADAGGEAAAKLWDYRVEEHGAFDADDIVKVRGSINIWKDAEQLKIDKIRHTAPDEVDLSAIIPCAPKDPAELYDELYRAAEGFGSADLKRLVQYALRENREKLLFFPAAVKLHHATRGGLLHHVWSILKLADAVCGAYPALDRDLVYTGVILHDIGKLRELDTGSLGLASAYTAEGLLIGHIGLGVSDVSAYCELLGIPRSTAMLVEHMLLSHHGQPEFGSPRYPMFPEAEVLAELDLLDSRLYGMFAALESVQEGAFSERQWALDNRQLYRIPQNTDKHEA